MQQSEILSLVDRLIPDYGKEGFDFILGQLTENEHPSAKILVKMELNRQMAPCTKSIDLRGRVQGECREYNLDGIFHWLDDVAFNSYCKNIKKFGGYTEGVWEKLINTKNNFRVMANNASKEEDENSLTDPESPYLAEPLFLGHDLKRQEKRLKVQSQVKISLDKEQIINGLSVDLSNSGAKFKVPSAFNYQLGQIIQVVFSDFAQKSKIPNIETALEYRILAIDVSYDNDAVRFLRTIRLTETNIIEQLIDETLNSQTKRTRHDNQDKVVIARTRSYEHTSLKHTTNLPLFFEGTDLKITMLTPNNHRIWQYWHDERNQQMLGSLLSPKRLESLIKLGAKKTSNIIYAFNHEHNDKRYFYSMMQPEASKEQRQLFWHLGARRPSWKVFRISVFELSDQERQELASYSPELANSSQALTHVGILQEIADSSVGNDYLLSQKPRLPSKSLNEFQHLRKVIGSPKEIYFDANSRRKEPRYRFATSINLITGESTQATGKTTDLSKRGISLVLDTPLQLLCKMTWIKDHNCVCSKSKNIQQGKLFCFS